ncbi:methyl farnesoate epoxidase [Orussus abietinus]|uniref:methyl farnesoate epoxidase n=1 Tax=Orussus abietinus TaxID=222816 RepID=UPI0006254E78|nr:methyl farnesoate epoxidase [Orussus abietinus]
MLLALLCVLLLVALCAYCALDCAKPAKFPPGPKWLPFVGCFPTFQRLRLKHGYAHLAFEVLSKIYGPILGLKLGKQRFIMISGHSLVKRVLLQEEFNGRPDGFFFRVRSFGRRKGVLFTEGHTWSQNRRFTMRHLRVFGFGRSIMAGHLHIEARDLVDNLLRQSEEGPVGMHTVFDVAVLNSLWTMFAGHRFAYEDEKLKEILQVVHDAFRLMDTMGGIMSYMPFLRYVIPELSGFKELMYILEKLWSFLSDEISAHERKLPESQPGDLIDAFLLEIPKNQGTDSIFTREDLLVLCLDLFLAGVKTTSDTLATTFMFLALHQDWVKTLQKDLDEVVGRDRSPTLEDVPSLPRVEAFLAEVQRYLAMAPLGVPHNTTKDVSLDGYEIPKDTIVILNYHSVHHDPAIWEDPEEFRPERFIDDNGRFSHNNAAIPFGIGKRRCLGEILARQSLFLYFTNVLHFFHLEISPEHGAPDTNGYDGFTISPKPYYLKLSSRTRSKD